MKQSKPRAKRSSRIEIVSHRVEIHDWNFDYLFGIDQTKIGHLPYWESRYLEIHGRILSPSLKASVGVIRLSESDELVESKLKSTDAAKPIGYISYRGASYSSSLYMPADAFPLVMQAFAAQKYRYVSMEGEKRGPGEIMVHRFMLLQAISEIAVPESRPRQRLKRV